MTEDAPRPALSRTDLDRVIRRAAELQFQEGADDGGVLSEEEVLRIGGEVGLDPGHIRRALGEVRAEALVPALPPDSGPLRRVVGPGSVRADRVIPGGADEVEQRLVRWLSKQESLDAVRRRAGFSLWEPAEGVLAQLQRGLKWGGQRYELAQARQLELSVQALEEGFSLVTLTADVRNLRMEQGGSWIVALSVVGGVAGAVTAVSFFPAAAAAAAGVAGAGLGGLGGAAAGRASFRQRAERVRLAAEGLLDRLERGEMVVPVSTPWRRR